MCNLYSLTKGQAAIRDWFRASNDRTATCRYSQKSILTKWLRSFATERTASVTCHGALGAAGACAGWPHADHEQSHVGSPTGAAGSASKTVASCRRLLFASTPIPSRARRQNGSRLARTVHCSGSLVYGPPGAACGDRRARQSMGSMSFRLCHDGSERRRRPN